MPQLNSISRGNDQMASERPLAELLNAAFDETFFLKEELPDHADAGKRHAVYQSEETESRYLVKQEAGQSYDASLARMLDAATIEGIDGVIWVTDSFMPKHRGVIEHLNRCAGGEQSYAAVLSSGKLWCGGLAQVSPPNAQVQEALAQVEVWERIAEKMRSLNPGFAAVRVSHSRSERPWLRLDVEKGKSGLYVDAFQKRRQMWAGIYFEGASRKSEFARFEAHKDEIERAIQLPLVRWRPVGENPATANIVVAMDQTLARTDFAAFEDFVIQQLTRFHVVLKLYGDPAAT